jgi:Xaa-Pro aminopeptidase
MNKIAKVQSYLQQLRIDGWLLYDFHRNNSLAHAFLEIPSGIMATRRFFYWIPAVGEPVKIVHAIEDQMLESWPGEKRVYSSWQNLEKELQSLLNGSKCVAMEYSPNNSIPYVSKVDAGTIDLVRSFGVKVSSSADFLLYFTSVLDQEQMDSQRRAATALSGIVAGAWEFIRKQLTKGITEWDVQQWILLQFQLFGLVSDSAPIVAVNEHSADPHFMTPEVGASLIKTGDFILIDLWAKELGDRTVFGDITQVAIAGEPSAKQQEVFETVRRAQKAGIALVRQRFAAKQPVQGWEVDEATRSVIRAAGYERQFIHRTGHNIEVELHGSGTHMDNLESHDARPIVPMTCFSIEPGIYLPGEFGVRLESDILIHEDGRVEVTGGEEDSLVRLN